MFVLLHVATIRDGSVDQFLPKSKTQGIPPNIAKDLCAADPKCTAFKTTGLFSNFGNADGSTNTTYDM